MCHCLKRVKRNTLFRSRNNSFEAKHLGHFESSKVLELQTYSKWFGSWQELPVKLTEIIRICFQRTKFEVCIWKFFNKKHNTHRQFASTFKLPVLRTAIGDSRWDSYTWQWGPLTPSRVTRHCQEWNAMKTLHEEYTDTRKWGGLRTSQWEGLDLIWARKNDQNYTKVFGERIYKIYWSLLNNKK